jgi:predicted transport protein
MKLFRVTEECLVPIQRNAFKLEQEIQTLVEQNLESLFNLRFVSSEYAIGKFRIDTLAFNDETNAFVIIEYKKGNSYSVVDQGYSYLSVMMNNKADFILEYNEKTGKRLLRDDVDWSSSRVIFVSPSFNVYQKNSVNFLDVPFDLWEIRRFEDSVIVLERCEPTSSASIDDLSPHSGSPTQDAVNAEVKVQNEQDHVAIMDSEMQSIWNAMREKLIEYADTAFFVSKQYISWKRDSSTICYIRLREKEIRIEILRGNKKPSGASSRGFFTLDDPKQMTNEKIWTWKNGQTGHAYNIILDKIESLPYVMYLLEQKYKSLE